MWYSYILHIVIIYYRNIINHFWKPASHLVEYSQYNIEWKKKNQAATLNMLCWQFCFTHIVKEQNISKRALFEMGGLWVKFVLSLSFIFFFLAHACSVWTFPGQGSNLRHSSNTGRALTCWITRQLLIVLFLKTCPCFKIFYNLHVFVKFIIRTNLWVF